jgi:hypothetical protein
MPKSTSLSHLLATLTLAARARGLNDSDWAKRAGVRKETLSRLRRRSSCDFATLHALAAASGLSIGATDTDPNASSSDGHFPRLVDRDYEERLLQLCAAKKLEPQLWLNLGPRFFMAGLAVMLASVTGFERRDYLALAEQLHPGASDPAVFALWLKRSPVRPARFLPMLDLAAKHAA